MSFLNQYINLKKKSEIMIIIKTADLLKNFDKSTMAYKSDQPCIIDFQASWCNPCRTIENLLNELEKENKDIIFYSVDIEDEYELAEIFSIKNLPTMILCSKNNDSKRLSGTIGKSAIQEKLNMLKKELV